MNNLLGFYPDESDTPVGHCDFSFLLFICWVCLFCRRQVHIDEKVWDLSPIFGQHHFNRLTLRLLTEVKVGCRIFQSSFFFRGAYAIDKGLHCHFGQAPMFSDKLLTVDQLKQIQPQFVRPCVLLTWH